MFYQRRRLNQRTDVVALAQGAGVADPKGIGRFLGCSPLGMGGSTGVELPQLVANIDRQLLGVGRAVGNGRAAYSSDVPTTPLTSR